MGVKLGRRRKEALDGAQAPMIGCLGSDQCLGRSGGSHGVWKGVADVDQRPYVGQGGNGRVRPWADGLLQLLPCGHWAGIPRMGLKRSKRPL